MDKFSIAKTLGTGDTTLTIASSATTSNYLDLGGMQLRGLLLPSNWTPCDIQFHVAIWPTTSNKFAAFTLADTTGTVISIPTLASQWLALLPYLFDAVPYVQIVCNAPQASSVIVQAALEPIYQGIHG